MSEFDALFALERSFDDVPGGAADRVLAGVEARLAAGGPDDGGGGGDGGPPPAPTSAGGATWAARAAYVAAGVVLGAGGHAALSRPSPAPVAAPIASAPVVATTAPPVGSPATRVEDLPVAPTAAPPPAGRASVAPPASPSPARTAEERADLDVARAALAHGRFEACLAGLADHQRTYGEGAFAEERESLWIQALASAGRVPEARARAARFRAKYPASLFGPGIERALSAK